MPDDIGVLAPGGGTRGITPAAQAELTRQRSQNISLPTRALGVALGAAETLVPPGASLPEIAATNFRALGTAALNYIKYGVGGVVHPAFEQGKAIGAATKAGDPHAQGAALAAVVATATGAKALYGRAAGALPPKVAMIDMTPSVKPLPDPLDVPTYQRKPITPNAQRFPTDQDVRLYNLKQRIKVEMPEVRGPFKLQAVDTERLHEIADDFGMYRSLLAQGEERDVLKGARPIGYDVVNRRGDYEFSITGAISRNGTAHLDIHGDQPGKLGTAAVRKILREFQKQHPEVTQIKGDRVTGAREAAATADHFGSPADNYFVNREAIIKLTQQRAKYEQHTAETILPKVNK